MFKKAFLIVAILGLLSAATCRPSAFAQVFRGSVDLIVIDATVIESDGTAVPDLDKGEFVVKVDGNLRPVKSIQFVALRPQLGDASRGNPAGATLADAAGAQPGAGRRIAVVFDHANIRAGMGRTTIQAIGDLLEHLSPTDQVGIASIPPPGPSLDFTTDHAEIRSALGHLAGSLQDASSRYSIGLTEAQQISRGSREALVTLRNRECRGERPGGPCEGVVTAEARRMWDDAQERSRASFRALDSKEAVVTHWRERVERSETSHTNGASRRSGERVSV